MTESPRSSRWRRVVGESTAIVASILIAFAIQAWWESIQDARTVRSHLQGIRNELEESRSQIRDYKVLLAEASSASQTLLSLTPEQGAALSPDSLAAMINRCIGAGSITIPTGATEALIASGDLSLLDDKDLSARIAVWPSLVRRAEEGGTVLRTLREEQFIPFLSRYAIGLTVMKKSGWLDEYPPSRLTPRVRALLEAPDFEGHVALRGLRLEVTRSDYDGLTAQLDSLVAAIDTALANDAI